MVFFCVIIDIFIIDWGLKVGDFFFFGFLVKCYDRLLFGMFILVSDLF